MPFTGKKRGKGPGPNKSCDQSTETCQTGLPWTRRGTRWNNSFEPETARHQAGTYWGAKTPCQIVRIKRGTEKGGGGH